MTDSEIIKTQLTACGFVVKAVWFEHSIFFIKRGGWFADLEGVDNIPLGKTTRDALREIKYLCGLRLSLLQTFKKLDNENKKNSQ
jgi:hypothetical protein